VRVAWFSELVNQAPNSGTRLHSGRSNRSDTAAALSSDGHPARDARQDFARLIGDLAGAGYLVEAFGEYWVHDHDELPERRLGIPALWPLAPETWDEDTF
jgi:hypothetical protein